MFPVHAFNPGTKTADLLFTVADCSRQVVGAPCTPCSLNIGVSGSNTG